jgi:hypothetical protein
VSLFTFLTEWKDIDTNDGDYTVNSLEVNPSTISATSSRRDCFHLTQSPK